jgi:hypothetical protein
MGAPPRALVEEASRRKMFFDSAGAPRIVANSRGKKRRPGAKDMASALRCKDPAFVSFLESCLRWDKRDRLTPEQARILPCPSSYRCSPLKQQQQPPPSPLRQHRLVSG